MELSQFHRLRAALQSEARRGAAAELAEAQARVRSSLAAAGWFGCVEVVPTDDVDSLVTARCRFPAGLSEEAVAQRLTRLWEEALRYPFWAAHATLVRTGRVELQAATRAGADGHYVTLHVVAQKAPQQVLIPAQRTGS